MKLLILVCTYYTFFKFNVALGDCRHHNAIFKSVHKTDHECRIYQQHGACATGDCSLRCRGLLARYWNDTVGLPVVTINRFYQPNLHDHEYYQRTQCCLGDVKSRLSDVCHRANASISCYNQHYGHLRTKVPEFVPFTELQHEQILQECIDLLQIPPSILAGYVKHGIANYPEAKCLLRCFMLREGLYTDAGGPDLHRMSVQCEGNYSEGQIRKKASRCIRNLQEQCLDKCELAYRIAEECVNGDIAVIVVFAGISTKVSTSLNANPSISVNLNGPSFG